MFQPLDLFVLSWVFLSVEAQTGQIPPPENVSLQWVDDFYPQLSWAPQPLPDNCSYVVASEGHKIDNEKFPLEPSKTSWNPELVMEGGSLNLSVMVACGDQHSKTVAVPIAYSELARDLQCYIWTSGQAHCSWLPVNSATDLPRFFYWLQNNDFTADPNTAPPPPSFEECSSYSKTGNRAGCDLQAHLTHTIYVLFKRTVNITVARNTYTRYFKDDVRPPPLNWTVTRTDGWLNIRWNHSDLIINRSEWTFTINYTVCDNKKTLTVVGEDSARLFQVARCPYSMKIRADTDGGEIPWSDEKHIGADANTGSKGLVYAVFIIPLMIAILVALAFAFYRKNKETIFPKVPEPRDFLSNISDNNNKISVCNLYVLAKEEDDCKITLVIDPQINKLYP